MSCRVLVRPRRTRRKRRTAWPGRSNHVNLLARRSRPSGHRSGLAVVFVVENRGPVAIRVLVPVVSTPSWTALAAMLLIGFVVGLLLGRAQR